MSKKYLIRKTVEDDSKFCKASFWKNSEILEINNWPWHTSELPEPPKIKVNLLYSNTHLFLNYYVKENYIQAKQLKNQGSVCQDSCVEFFVTSNNGKYFNFEVNCIGTLLLGYRKDRHDKIPVDFEDLSGVDIVTSLPKGIAIFPAQRCPKDGYTVSYSIPFSLLSKYAGSEAPISGTVWKANFYKCGDLTPEPSWGCWNFINTPQPDFHRPEFFGRIIFE